MTAVRRPYEAWLKRETGQNVDESEDLYADEFETLWREALVSGNRKFISCLEKILRAPRKREFLLREEAVKALFRLARSSPNHKPTWLDVKAEAERNGIKVDARRWQQLRKEKPFCDYFPAP